MKNGFVKVAAATPDIRVADVEFNTQNIINAMEEAQKNGAKILVFPELCVTGYTCSDLFDHSVLLKASRKALLEIAENTNDKDMLVFVGAPLEVNGKLYNVAAAMNQGEIIGFTTKTFLPNYGEFYEMRQFTPGPQTVREITFEGKKIPFGPQILFQAEGMEELVVAAEICEDVWSPIPPSIQAALEGATVIVNCSASDETIGKDTYRRALISGQSARLISGYIYANAGEGESTTDLVFGGHNIIAENGTVLKESSRYVNEIIYSELDLQRITGERRKNTTFQPLDEETLVRIPFTVEETKTFLTRTFPKKPFVPSDEQTRAQRCEEILTIQAMGLKKRLAHTNARTAVVGISGGLDSTLALLVTARAFDMLGRDKKDIIAVTMPCFGTTDRTYQNACEMSKKVGATLIEVPIADAENVHFRAIAHGDGAVLGGDIAPGEGKGQLAQGVADGVHVLAHVELIGIAQGDRLEDAHVDFQHSDGVLLFTAHQGGVLALAVGEKHLDVADAVDDVIIGEDVAGAAVAADDEAGAGYGGLHRIAEHIGIHIAVDAHRRAQVGGVDLLG